MMGRYFILVPMGILYMCSNKLIKGTKLPIYRLYARSYLYVIDFWAKVCIFVQAFQFSSMTMPSVGTSICIISRGWSF